MFLIGMRLYLLRMWLNCTNDDSLSRVSVNSACERVAVDLWQDRRVANFSRDLVEYRHQAQHLDTHVNPRDEIVE